MFPEFLLRKKKAKSYDELPPDMLQDYMTDIKTKRQKTN